MTMMTMAGWTKTSERPIITTIMTEMRMSIRRHENIPGRSFTDQLYKIHKKLLEDKAVGMA